LGKFLWFDFYRYKNSEFLKIDFPYIPIIKNKDLYYQSSLGADLICFSYFI